MSIKTESHAVAYTGSVVDNLTFPNPGAGGTYKAVRVSNFSPYVFVINGVGDDPVNSQPAIKPLTIEVYETKQANRPVILTALTAALGSTPAGFSMTLEFSDNPEVDFDTKRTKYPATMGGLVVVQDAVDVTVIGNQAASSAPTVGQVTLTDVVSEIVGANATRSGLTIKSLSANTEIVYIGPTNAVTVLDGYPLEPGFSVTLGAPSTWYGITVGGSAVVGYEDE